MHIILISVFIGIFFFTYGIFLQKEIIKIHIEYIVNDLITSVKVFMPKSEKVKKYIRDYDIKIDESQDEKVRDKNKYTLIKGFISIFIFAIIGLLIILAVSKKMNRENMTHTQFWFKLLKYNIITLVFIALTQFIFVSYFFKKFMLINTNKLKKSIIDNIINYFTKNI